ncbi:MAG: RluA family pseudouridine synthase [Clostridia bacterium]
MEYIVKKQDVGKRLDVYIVEKKLDITRSYIKKLVKDGNILVNKNVVKSGYSLKEFDTVFLQIPEDFLADIRAEDINLKIIYEDEDLIIVDKEKGMVVHPANGNYNGTMVNALMYSHADKLSGINGCVRPGIVHRIDKDTSGILVVAKNDNAHKNLSEQFSKHSISRKYIAIVKGIIREDEFCVNMPIGRNPKDRKKMAVTYKNSKEAITHIKVLERYYNSSMTLIEASLETGRTHQIRVHLAYKGHPLLGDETYGKKEGKFKVTGHMLHAKKLGIIHPTTGKYVVFESPLPDEFAKLVEILRRREE